MTLYETCLENDLEIDSHESDLYVKVTADSVPIVEAWVMANPQFAKPTTFTDQNGAAWYDCPFVYDPWWT